AARRERQHRPVRSVAARQSRRAGRSPARSAPHDPLVRPLHGLRGPRVRSGEEAVGAREGARMSRLAIFGIGNVLAQDDAVGPTVIHWLNSRYTFPSDVLVEDLGTPALELPTHLAGHRFVIFIDAVAASDEP